MSATATIALQFCHGPGIVSEAIGWFTQAGPDGPTHVDAVMPEGLLGAHLHALGGATPGVAVRPFGYARAQSRFRIEFQVDGKAKARWEEWLRSQCGKPYDSAAIAGLALGRQWRSAEAWFCSELQLVALELLRLWPGHVVAPACRVSPEMLFVLCSAFGRVQELGPGPL